MERAWRDALRTLCVAFLLSMVAITLQASPTTFSVENQAPNTPGGQRYTRALGDDWTKQALQKVKAFIVKTLSPSYRNVDHVTFIVKSQPGLALQNSNNRIEVGAEWLAEQKAKDKNDLRFQIKGLLFHELTHSFQNNRGDYGNDPHFRGVIEGIATYMELVADYGIDPRKKGGNWFDGYHTTAHFFAWINRTQKRGFVNLLNQRMGQFDWNDNFFKTITGKNVNTLWALYQKSF